jgi:C-terminal processing protease CtpA/Prc
MNVDPAFSAADGTFTIAGVPVGPVNVLCGWSPGYSDSLTRLTVSEGDNQCEAVVVKSDRPLGGLAWFGGEIGADPIAGVHIVSVLPGSPADKAGVQRGDVLATVDGLSVVKLSPIGDEFAIRDREPGSHVALGVARNGRSLPLDVVVTGAPAQ